MARKLFFGRKMICTTVNTKSNFRDSSKGIPIGYTIDARSDSVSETSDISGPTISRPQHFSTTSGTTSHKVSVDFGFLFYLDFYVLHVVCVETIH
jgi:hypothetical protein